MTAPTAASPAPLAAGDSPPFRVTYRDTDQMGVAYHGNYFAWFETGRTELLRSLGALSYRQWEADEGVMLPVLDCSAEFKRPVRYDDLLVVTTQVTAASDATVAFRYEVRRAGEPDVLAAGTTRHVFVNRPVRAARRLMPFLFQRP